MNLFNTIPERTVSIGVLCLTCTALTPMAVYAQNDAPSEATAEEDPNTITVTATRRNLQVSDVPLSISALSQDMLTTQGVRDSTDIAYVVPGLSVIGDGFGAGTESVSVRGIVALGSAATTAYYIDETPVSQQSGGYFSPRYFDIERVEVLRGPQGTLFGASAVGGVIRVINKRPNLSRFEGAVRAEGSTTRLAKQNYIVDGAVNVPIINDVLALRITGFYEKQSGRAKAFVPIFSDDPADYFGVATVAGEPVIDPETGQPVLVPGVAYKGFTGSGKRVGGQTLYGGRAALLFQPADALKLTGTYHWQQNKNDGFNTADQSIGLGLSGTDFRQARSTLEFRKLRSQLANLTGEFDAGFAKITSSTSYEKGFEFTRVDLSATAIGNTVALLGVLPRDAGGQAGAMQPSQTKKTNFTQEVRLVSAGDGPFNWIFGGFYNNSKSLALQNYMVRGLTALLGNAVPGDNIGSGSAKFTTREFSVFGEVGYKFTDTLSATAGLRSYRVTTGSAIALSTIGLVGGGLGIVETPADPKKFKETGLTYKAVLNYKPSDSLLVFAGYTTGYRPGGVNVAPVVPGDDIPQGFTSDKLSQYELGWKSSWLDRALTVNGALFYIDWSDIPTTVQAPSGFFYTINGPKARNYGGELEIVMRPTKGFDVSFGLTVLNAKYSETFEDLESGLRIEKGQRLTNVPDITLNAAVNYEWSIGGDARARFGANVAHVTKRTQVANATESPLPGFVNAGLSTGINFGKFDVSIFARNLFDTRALVGNIRSGNEVAGGFSSAIINKNYIQPRTIGASIQFMF